MRKLFVTLSAAILASATVHLRAEVVNGIIAIVHDSVITLDDVDVLNRQTLESLARQYRDQPWVFNQKRGQVTQENLEKLTEQQLILHEFDTAGYNLPENFIDGEIEDEIRKEYGDRLHLTMSLQQEGMTFEEYRRRTRERIIVLLMRQKNIASEVIISPHKVEAYYLAHKDEYKMEDEVKLRMIVLDKNSNTNPPAEKLAADCYFKLQHGTPFDDMLKELEQQKLEENRNGGSWYQRTSLMKELADTAFALKSKQYSTVIDTTNTCYLLNVEDRHPAHTKSLGEVRDIIERNLQLEERNRLEKAWIDRLKKKTFIRTF